MGLKCWRFYSNVSDTTLKAKAVSGQSIFVKKDEEKFYGKDKRKVIVLSDGSVHCGADHDPEWNYEFCESAG